MEKARDMKKHVTIVGALHIGFGILGLIGAVIAFFALSFASSFVEGVDVAQEVMKAIMVFVPIMISLTSILSIIGGIGLFSYNQWARILVIVLSALSCLNIPIGTAKGVYSMWALLQDDTVRLFNEKAGEVQIN